MPQMMPPNATPRENLEATLALLEKDPFAASLASHKLKGKLAGRWACTVEFDLRIVFRFIPSASDEEDDIQLLEIGTHDEVY